MPDDSEDRQPTPEQAPSQEAAEAAAAALRRVTRSTQPGRRRSAGRSPGSTYADARDPQPLSAAVERLVQDQGWQDQSAISVLIQEWADVVGRELADHVVPVSFDDGELTLRAESTAWATQVRLLLPQLHRAVDDRVGSGVVRRIRVHGPQAPSWGAGPRRVKGRGPRDTYG